MWTWLAVVPAALWIAMPVAGAAPAAGSPTVQLVSSEALIGRGVDAPDGALLGFIEYLRCDAADGAVRAVVLDPASALDRPSDFIALRWRTLAQPLAEAGGPLSVTVSRAAVASAPRLQAAAITDDRRPDVFALSAVGGESSAAAGVSHRTIDSANLDGLDVVADDGRLVATVDRAMIDAADGRIAYLVVLPTEDRDGSGRIAMPFEGIAWSDEAGYRAVLHGALHADARFAPLLGRASQQAIDPALLAALRQAYAGHPAAARAVTAGSR